jgi:signal transduction histidine kinase
MVQTSDQFKATILTVDDNDILRYSVSRILLDAGFRVIEAKTGAEALELSASLPDLITLDINLPDVDGFQVCKQIKANPATNHIPVLHLSSTFVDPGSRVQGLKGGADAYLPEPVDRAELVATVEALLRSKRGEKEARLHAVVAETSNLELEAKVLQRTAEIERKSEEIRRLNARLVKLQDEERRRLARELHDSTGQALAALSINLSQLDNASNLDSARAKALIAESTAITSELSSQLRTVSYLLHPPSLDELGLTSALRWYVEGFAERSNISVHLSIEEKIGRFSENMEIAIFRIVQECLTNIHRHSGSKSATVALHREGDNIVLEVTDQGTKVQKRPAKLRGVGLLGMTERARQLGGDLVVEFGPTGTRVRAVIPAGVKHNVRKQSRAAK